MDILSLTALLNLDSVLIKSAANIVYQQNSLTPSLIFAERPVNFRLKVYNTGGTDIILDQTSRVAFLTTTLNLFPHFCQPGWLFRLKATLLLWNFLVMLLFQLR